MMSGRSRLLVFLCPAVLAACQHNALEEPANPTEDTEEDQGVMPVRERDLAQLMRRTHFSFREEAGRVTAGHSTHAVDVGDSRFEFTPFFPVSSDDPAPVAVPGAPIGLETIAVERGETEIAEAAADAVIETDGTVSIARGPVVEHLENEEEGVEQSWSFAAMPEGEGDLVVRVRVDGTQGYISSTETGLHFDDPLTGLGVRYGVATWIDANGNETTVTPTFEGGEIVIRVAADVVAQSAYPAVLDPVVAAEQGVDSPVLAPAVGRQSRPAIAFGPNQHFVVWTDYRTASTSFYGAIYGARIAKDGTVLDPDGILITSYGGDDPQVIWDGLNYYVGWQRGVSIATTRVSAAGVVLATPISAYNAQFSFNPTFKLASDGVYDYVAVSEGGFVGYTPYSREGELIYQGQSPLYVVPGPSAQGEIDLDCSTETRTCLLAAEQPWGVFVHGFNHATSMYFEQSIFDRDKPRVGHVGTDLVLLTRDMFDQTSLFTMSFTSWGAVSEATSASLLPSPLVIQDMTCTTTQCAFVADDRSVWTRDFTGSGGAWTSLASYAPDAASSSSLDWDGTDFTVAYSALLADGEDVKTVRVAPTGKVYPARLASTRVANDEESPSVACDSASCLVAWRDIQPGRVEVVGTMTTKAGAPLQADATRLGCLNAGSTAGSPSVGSNGSMFLVAFECAAGATRGVSVSGVSSAGGILYRDLALPSPYGDDVAPRVAAANNGPFFVVRESRDSLGNADVRGTLVPATNAPALPADVVVSAATNSQVEPAVTFNGAEFVVAWEDWRRGAAFGPDVMAARVTASGSVLDANGIVISSRATAEARPSIASNGSATFIVWEDNRSGSWDIYGARLSGATVQDPNGVSLGTPTTSDQLAPQVAFNGTNYQVVWEDQRSGVHTEIYGRQVTPAGTNSGGAFLVATGPDDVTAPAVVGDAAGGSLVFYQRYVPSLGTGRVRGRAIAP
ncbi:MAG: hypothetical protein U0271_25600 [Polyangiaceae bacterium]